MLQDMVHSQDQQLSIEEITSPIGAQIFDFCESELFPETLQNSEVASTSNRCYEEQSSCATHPSITPAMNKYNTTTTVESQAVKLPGCTSTGPSTPTAPATTTTNLSVIFNGPTEDRIENDISASIDFIPSPSFSTPHHQYLNNAAPTTNNNCNNDNQEPFNISSLNDQISLGDIVNGSLHTAHQYGPEPWSTLAPSPSGVVPILGPPLPTSYEEDCMPSMQSYIRLRSSQPACSLVDPMMAPYLPSGSVNAPFSGESSGIFTGNSLMLGTDLSHQELELQRDNSGLFLPDNIPRIFNCSSELQAVSSESQHLVHGGANTAPLASEMSSLEDPIFKVGKLSVEERKRKIHRYMKKRNERNFSKKIKYACRKTLADRRPRVRGRFAKNDELGDIARTTGSNHEDDTDEDIILFSNSIPDRQRRVAVKEEDELESSDIFSHISGVNSFKCNYPIQSWI